MLERWCHYFPSETFFEQTAVTYAASLQGRESARNIRAEQDISLAWHIAAFGMAAYAGKLKPLKKYLKPTEAPVLQSGEQMLEALESLKASGTPMDIKQIN